MKETQLQAPDKIEIQKQAEKKTELQYVGSLKPKRGHTLFEVDVRAGTIEPAKFQAQDADYLKALKGDLSGKKTVITKEGCIYISALNKKNVLKKLNK